MEPINWKAFRAKLSDNPNLGLQFKYAENQYVDAAYHITEIKQAPITSVDCGGVLNKWTEVIIQLWVPDGAEPTEAMKVGKALSIVELVENLMPIDPMGTVKIEFGNSEFDTRQMFPNGISVDGDNLTVNLKPEAVQCKAINRGGSCGIAGNNTDCCSLDENMSKSKLQFVNLTPNSATCRTPGDGCC